MKMLLCSIFCWHAQKSLQMWKTKSFFFHKICLYEFWPCCVYICFEFKFKCIIIIPSIVARALRSQPGLNKPLITVLITLNMPPLCIPNCCSMMTMRMNFFFVSKLFPGHFYVYRQEKITPPNWFLYFSVWNHGLYYSTPQDCNVRNIPKG